jgi:HD-like signal output (HDOD) protein
MKMLNPQIEKILDSIKDIPSIPTVAAAVLKAMEDPLVGAKDISKIVDKDQSLALRILRMANSPIYGFERRISTIDLAVVILGMDNLREIIMSYIVQGFFSKVKSNVFNTIHFWEYSLLSASAARIIARRLKYKLAGEAFISGLMHDIGLIIIAEYFTKQYEKIKQEMQIGELTITQLEKKHIGATHAEIGFWLTQKWNLPLNMCNAVLNHHNHYSLIDEDDDTSEYTASVNFGAIKQPLTAIISISEWITWKMDKSEQFVGKKAPEYYLAEELFSNLSEHDFLNPESQFGLIINEIKEEYEMVIEELVLN